MADKNIGLLPAASGLDDDSQLVAEQQGQAVKVSGALFKQFAKDGVAEYVDSAKTAAGEAKESAAKAAEDAAKLDESVAQAAASAAAAEESNQSAQAAQGKAEAAQGASETAKEAAEAAQSLAEAAQIDARQAAAAAATSEGNAKSSETAAKDSETASKTAQEAAEAAQGKAEAASTTAAGKATEAAQSAEKAEQYSGKPPLVQGGNWWTWNAEKQAYEDTGKKAILTYDKTYSSVQAMNADIQPENTVAIISSSVDDEDNAKLYISDGAKWNYLTDLSGFTGVGVAKVEQTSGDHAPGTTDVYTLTLTDGTTQTIPVYNGKNGEGSGDMEASTYDPNGKKTDVYQYADDAASAAKDAIPTKVSELENDSKYLTSESDPTVPDWAKQSEKPKYTAAEVGAVPSGQGVPAGGAEGEALVKASDKDYDTTWEKIKAGAVLTGIAITTPPTKTDYAAGESFSTAGMVVTATYDTGVTAQCTGYTYDTAGLKVTDTAVTIAYTEGGVTATAVQAITVAKTALTVPSQWGTVTYNGLYQSPEWYNYDSSILILGGETGGTDAGDYAVTFTIKDTDLYEWADGSTHTKSVGWILRKATPTLSLSATQVVLDDDNTSAPVTVITNSDGAVSASSSDTSVATVSVSGKTVTIEGVGGAVGSATVTVSVAASTNYLAASGTTVEVTATKGSSPTLSAETAALYGLDETGTVDEALARAFDYVPVVRFENAYTEKSADRVSNPESLSADQSSSSGAAVKIGDYALFGGGSTTYSTVDYYTSSLVHGTATALSTARLVGAAATVGNYALFAGGSDKNNNRTSTVDYYTSSLVHGTATALSTARLVEAAATIGDYALFLGGSLTSTKTTVVDAYSSSLVRSTATALSAARSGNSAITVGNYALCGGDYDNTGTVDYYTSSLVHGTTTAFYEKKNYYGATTVGNYALFGGGWKSSVGSSVVDAYSSSLVRSTATALNTARGNLAATTLGTVALFGGGYTGGPTYYSTVETYTSSLVHGTTTALGNARANPRAATVGNYALFGGGSSSSSASGTYVDAYGPAFKAVITIPALSKYKFDGYQTEEVLTLTDKSFTHTSATAGLTGYIKRGCTLTGQI